VIGDSVNGVLLVCCSTDHSSLITDHSSLKANDYLKQKPEEESPGQV